MRPSEWCHPELERTKYDSGIVRAGEVDAMGKGEPSREDGWDEKSSSGGGRKLWLMTLGHSLPGNQGPGAGEARGKETGSRVPIIS